jgi:4-amino-4-deoxy-L-arabinose transferase-like glycosyltransferase
LSGPHRNSLDRLALPILAGIFAAGWYLVDAGRDTPIIDDWVYAWSVEHFLQTGELRVLGYSGFYPLAQILWGAPFAKILGFSFAALRASTVCLSILGCWAWYLTLVELGCDLRSRVLATLVLVFNPVYFALSYSFMTDVPFLSLTNLAVYFVVSAARRERPRRLWVAATFAVAAVAGGPASDSGYSVKLGHPSNASCRPRSWRGSRWCR